MLSSSSPDWRKTVPSFIRWLLEPIKCSSLCPFFLSPTIYAAFMITRNLSFPNFLRTKVRQNATQSLSCFPWEPLHLNFMRKRINGTHRKDSILYIEYDYDQLRHGPAETPPTPPLYLHRPDGSWNMPTTNSSCTLSYSLIVLFLCFNLCVMITSGHTSYMTGASKVRPGGQLRPVAHFLLARRKF